MPDGTKADYTVYVKGGRWDPRWGLGEVAYKVLGYPLGRDDDKFNHQKIFDSVRTYAWRWVYNMKNKLGPCGSRNFKRQLFTRNYIRNTLGKRYAVLHWEHLNGQDLPGP